jgi:hypothetical protein
LAASDNGNSAQVTSAIGNIDSAIASGVSNGTIAQDEASTLTTDVTALANALGVSTTTTTTTAGSVGDVPGSSSTLAPPPGPGNGRGQDQPTKGQ